MFIFWFVTNSDIRNIQSYELFGLFQNLDKSFIFNTRCPPHVSTKQHDDEFIRKITMKSQFVLYCFLSYAMIISSCTSGEIDDTPNPSSEKISFMVMNRTGHNGPASLNCGGEPETVEFTFVTPAQKLIRLMSGDTQELVGLEIIEGERLTVMVKDPQSNEELVTKSTLFNPTENKLPEGADPLIRLCPKDFLEFKYF